MSRATSFTRDELLAAVPGLSDEMLDALTRAGVVQPAQAQGDARFRSIDRARLRLALELDDVFEMDRDALALVLSLIDQVNGLRGEMRAMLSAIAAEPPETRARMRQVIRETRIVLREE